MNKDDICTTNVGTQQYQAPERQIGDNSNFTIKADVWSLGLSVYNIAVDGLPFSINQTIFEFVQLIKKMDHLSLPDNYEATPELRDFIVACLRVSPEKRPDYNGLLSMDFLSCVDVDRQRQHFSEFVIQTIDDYNSTLPTSSNQ